ncbi:iron-containing redox enzyme family protein [Pseudoduganella aquatica]|uniref:iron-containing redox enzyme family protein n=1 Tax=Pseudoduganella aquatica TaxID=2660641 RepID=UPI001E62C44F|nr:iron-containing redox enzyme family protein [Pseudoduganella aquatica]
MLSQLASSDTPSRIYAVLSSANESLPVGDAAAYLRSQLNAAAAQPPLLPLRYDELAAWIGHHAQAAADAYHRYQVAREYGAPRRHFATIAQARHFLREAAPGRLADGASLYGVVERWDDVDFQPMIASYLEQLGHGVPDRNRYLLYRDLLASGSGAADAGPVGGATAPDRWRSGALELALAHSGEDFLPELIGYNLGRQQPCTDLLVARHELAELGLNADAFASAGVAAGSGPSALLSLRGIMARVGDPAAFYRRVADGYRLHALATRLPLPAASDAMAPLGAEPVLPPDAVADRAAPPPVPQPPQASAGDDHGPHIARSGQAAQAGPGMQAGRAEQAGSSEHGLAAEPQQRVRAERPVIRHHFPADEHAWEAIGCELRLLEARLAASDSKEEAMATLSRLLAPALQHSPAGLMAARIYTQLFNL